MTNTNADYGRDGSRLHAIIQYLNEILRLDVSFSGDPVDAVILRTVHLGEIEGRLFDVTSLASVTAMTVPTAARRVTALIDQGQLDRYRDGRSYRLVISAAARERLQSAMRDYIARSDELISVMDRGDAAAEGQMRPMFRKPGGSRHAAHSH